MLYHLTKYFNIYIIGTISIQHGEDNQFNDTNNELVFLTEGMESADLIWRNSGKIFLCLDRNI
jgi:hypothetical protein